MSLYENLRPCSGCSKRRNVRLGHMYASLFAERGLSAREYIVAAAAATPRPNFILPFFTLAIFEC